MTRGKIILIDKDKDTLEYYITCEFNGDMYIKCHGKNIIKELEHIRNYDEFKTFTTHFNEQNFGYEDFEIYNRTISDGTINVCKNYLNNWFSDYLYFKNISGIDINMVCNNDNRDIETKVLKNNEIMVFNFGKYIDYQTELDKITNN